MTSSFYCVSEDSPAQTTDQLRDACVARDIEYVQIAPTDFDFSAVPTLEDGSMLYRADGSDAAIMVEQVLFHPRVASFYATAELAHLVWDSQPLLFARSGVPTPRTIPYVSRQRALLRLYVDYLGGFPVVLKVMGGSLGVGVLRAESLASLFSLVDYVDARGARAILMPYIEPAFVWRVVVVGEEAVATYVNRIGDDDFRSYVEEVREDFERDCPSAVVEAALAAVAVQGLEFGGVDVLVHESGRVYVLEANFPCYFGYPKDVAGIDVAGRMLDHLMAKAVRLRAER